MMGTCPLLLFINGAKLSFLVEFEGKVSLLMDVFYEKLH